MANGLIIRKNCFFSALVIIYSISLVYNSILNNLQFVNIYETQFVSRCLFLQAHCRTDIALL